MQSNPKPSTLLFSNILVVGQVMGEAPSICLESPDPLLKDFFFKNLKKIYGLQSLVKKTFSKFLSSFFFKFRLLFKKIILSHVSIKLFLKLKCLIFFLK